MTTFPLGKLPVDESRPKLRLGPRLRPRIAGAILDTPTADDNMSQVPSWPMYANDCYGDCVWAMVGHSTQALTQYSQGQEYRMAEASLLKAYSAVTGFNPKDPSTDNGTVMQDAMDYWRKTGVEGHKILAFALVDHTNLDEVRAAIHLFGSVQVGFNFPRSAWTQFDNGKPWDVVSSDGGIQGGQAIHVGAYTQGKGVQLTTWGRVTGMTEAFWQKYVDECWVIITEDWLAQNGLTPDGLDLHGLGDDFAQLTGGTNPFPQPLPPTPPTPPAPPTPDQDPADVALAKAADEWMARRHWRRRNRMLEVAFATWMQAKGLS